MNDEERFWSNVDRRGPNECWPWLLSKGNHGHGSTTFRGVHTSANHVAFMLGGGVFTEEKPFACHSCDNPPCCNPSHLWAGSQRDNMADRDLKGRQARGDRQGLRVHPERAARGNRNGKFTHPEKTPRGENNGWAKLTKADVIKIRAAAERGDFLRVIASRFNIGTSQTHNIVKRKQWRHVP